VRPWNCHALDWLHHGTSATLPTETFIARSIKDVMTEVQHVRGGLPDPNKYVLMGHSMGGLACLYSSQTLRPRAMATVGALDTLTPPSTVQQLCTMMNARYVAWAGAGHSDILLKESAWLPVAQDIRQWMVSVT